MQKIVEELGIYVLTFDRAGYGESDPNPKRTLKSDTFDIQELADKLELGSKFYLIGLSIGNYTSWGCLKYLPHRSNSCLSFHILNSSKIFCHREVCYFCFCFRLSGVALVVPVTNYWWPSFPSKLVAEAINWESGKRKMNLRIAHYFPALLHWWMNNKMEMDPSVFSRRDVETIKTLSQVPLPNSVRAFTHITPEQLVTFPLFDSSLMF